MALYDDYLNQNKNLLDYYGGLRGTSTGLSPETYAGLQTNALESVPAQFDKTESDLFTALQRQNPTGLPMGGEYLRAFAPLEAAKQSTQAGLLRDLMLQNEAEKRRTLDLNNQRAFEAAGQYGNLGTALLGQNQQQNQFEASQGLTREQNQLNRENAIRLAEINNQPASFKNLLLSSLLSAGLAPTSTGGTGLLGKGINAIVDLFGGGNKGNTGKPITPGGMSVDDLTNLGLGMGGATLPLASSLAATGPSLAGGFDALAGTGLLPQGTAAAGAGTGSGIGGAITGFLTNPITIAAGAALGIGVLWSKSQAHHEANTWVQGFQNKFDNTMGQIGQQEQSGQVSSQDAEQLRAANTADVANAAIRFASQGSDQAKVIGQWLRDSFFKYYGQWTNALDPATLAQLKQIQSRLR